MEAIAVRGAVFPRASVRGWIWLRVRVTGKESHVAESTDVCVGKLPLSQASLDAIAPIQLQTPGTGDVCLEVWVAATRDAPFMQFFGACRIDPAAWARDEPHERWYGLDLPASKRKSAWGEDQQSTSAYRDAAPENERAGAFVKVVAVFTHRNKLPPMPSIDPLMETDGQQGFQFIMPHKTIRRRALLRRLSVHDVKHQCQIGVLEELLTTTLYGAFGDRGEAVSGDRGLDKALTLLQLSCQYALHTTTELQKSSWKVEADVNAYNRRGNRLSQLKSTLEERRCNLARERDVLDCALDGMKMMLPADEDLREPSTKDDE